MTDHADDLMIIEEQEGVHVVRLLAEALLDPVEIDHVEEQMLRLVESSEEPRIVIALDTVDHVSSLMISTLIKIRQEVASRSGEVCLASVPPRLQALFEVVRLGDVFEMYESTAAAVNALRVD